MNELDCPAQSPTSSNISGENRNANCEPNLIAQHHCPNLTKALVAELDQIPASGSQICWEASPKDLLQIPRCWSEICLRSFGHFGGIFENHREQEIGYRITKTWRTRKRRMVSDKKGR